MSTFAFDAPCLDRLYRYCCALTGDESAAYDLLQDGVERYLRREDAGRVVDKPEALLRRIVRNRFIDNRRTDHRDQQDLMDDEAVWQLSLGFHGLDDLMIARQDLDQIWASLNPLERELLHLWAVEGYTAQEVADIVQEPRGTILSRIHRLRRRLERWRAARADLYEAPL